MKQCNVCEETKPLTDFYQRSGVVRTGKCKDCQRAENRGRYNKPRRRARRTAPVLPEEEVELLRRVHKVTPDQIGYNNAGPKRPPKKHGTARQPFPDWVEEFFDK